ncbi:protein kinase [Chloroflexota bacterium]
MGREIGGYRVIEQIGAGGMAKVYKAYQPAFDRFVALKILPETYAEDETYLKRFEREAKVIARLEHRHILPVFDFGEDDKIAYLAMRYLQAGTLKELITKAPGHKLPLGDTAQPKLHSTEIHPRVAAYLTSIALSFKPVLGQKLRFHHHSHPLEEWKVGGEGTQYGRA